MRAEANHSLVPLQHHLRAGVAAREVVPRCAAVGENLFAARILNVDDGTPTGCDSATGSGGRSTSECDRAEVSKGHKTTTRLEILNNPLCIGLAKAGRGASASKRVRDLFTSRQVLESGNPSFLGRGIDLHVDLITDTDVEVGEGVRVVGDPFVPSIERTVAIERDTSLKDGSAACVTVNANPRGGSRVTVTADLGDSDGANHLGEACADLDGACPVARVLRITGIPHCGSRKMLGTTIPTTAWQALRSGGKLGLGQG